MTILETIKADMLRARKAKSPIAGALVTLKGEIDSKQKSFSPARDITDEEVLAVVKKFLKGVTETISLLEGKPNTEALEAAKAEKVALEAYMPAQMTEDELLVFVRQKAGAGAKIGEIMGALKAEKGGQYDGRLASIIVKKVLAEA